MAETFDNALDNVHMKQGLLRLVFAMWSIAEKCMLVIHQQAALFVRRMCLARRPLDNHDPHCLHMHCLYQLDTTWKTVQEDLIASREQPTDEMKNFHIYRAVRMAIVYMYPFLFEEERAEADELLQKLDADVEPEMRDMYFVLEEEVFV